MESSMNINLSTGAFQVINEVKDNNSWLNDINMTFSETIASVGGTMDFISEEDMEALRKITVPVPPNEGKRLNVLRLTNLLDSDTNDPEFDRFTSLASRILDVPTVLISLVDRDRSWFKSSYGAAVIKENPRNFGLCSFVVLPEAPEIVIVPDLHIETRFSSNPRLQRLRFFAGAALIVQGVRVGSFTVIDYKPRYLSLQEKGYLLDLAAAVSAVINSRYMSSLNVMREKTVSILKMAHDIRTPLMSATMANSTFDHYFTEIIPMISKSIEGQSVIAHLNHSMGELNNAFNQLENAVKMIITETETSQQLYSDHKHEQVIEGKLLHLCTTVPNTSDTSTERTDTSTISRDSSLVSNISSTTCIFPSTCLTSITSTDYDSRSPPSSSSSSSTSSTTTTTTTTTTTVIRVLIVDDSASIRKLMKRLLEAYGCYVDDAENGKIGLNKLKLNKYDIAFVDFLMPVMSGPDMVKQYTKWLETQPKSNDKGVLLWGMSATAMVEEQLQGINAGMHLFSNKPLSKDNIQSMITLYHQSPTLIDLLEKYDVNRCQ